MIEIFLLSLIQGITEFLPISSSSHLIIFSDLTDYENKNLSIDVSLHIGSFLAVITYFHKDIKSFIQNKNIIHVLNAISPAFTCSFGLSNYIYKEFLR